MIQQSMFSMGSQDSAEEENLKRQVPLAARMRPKTLDEFVGQGQIVGEGRMLFRLIRADRLSSAIFYGPPGSGKTTLAKIIAESTNSAFYEINAVTSGKKEMVDVLEKARQNQTLYQKRTILFIDEIHRFNKAQQDLLLPGVEQGLITLIGATTQNPYFEINSPLLSRSTIFEFRKLSEDEVIRILKKAIEDTENGLGYLNVKADEKALTHLARVASGDARRALNALELAALSAPVADDGYIHVDLETAQECIQKKAVLYDKDSDAHYDTISAFIKSIRGSDPDAGVFWLAKMLLAGEDPLFIARRLVILASEDVGNADPQALPLAVATMQAVQMIGLPEAELNLSQCVTYLASAPKSNSSTVAIAEAKHAVDQKSNGEVPIHLMDSHYKGAAKLGHGKGYQYPHSYPGNYVVQEYLPEDIRGARFYEPSHNGYEEKIGERLDALRARKSFK